jgi:hypothetical protein
MWATEEAPMRSDARALLEVFAWSGVVALVVIGILVVAALGGLKPEVAVGIAAVCLIAGAVLIGTKLRGALLGLRPPADRPDGPPEADRP